LDPEEHMRLTRALQIRNRVVNDVAVPLSEIRAIPVAQPGCGPTVSEVEHALRETGYSRFPVVGADDSLIGYLHIKDVLSQIDDPDSVLDISVVRHLPRVAADMALPDALSQLRRDNSHLALVTGADGAVCAMVALEDLVEDLVGTVRDGMHRA
jgi:CBS domain containing-hemolysin-like protein